MLTYPVCNFVNEVAIQKAACYMFTRSAVHIFLDPAVYKNEVSIAVTGLLRIASKYNITVIDFPENLASRVKEALVTSGEQQPSSKKENNQERMSKKVKKGKNQMSESESESQSESEQSVARQSHKSHKSHKTHKSNKSNKSRKSHKSHKDKSSKKEKSAHKALVNFRSFIRKVRC